MDPNNSASIPAAHTAPSRIPPPRGYALSGKLMLSAIVGLFTVVLLVLFIRLYVRWQVYRRESSRSRRGRSNPLVFAAGDHAPSSLAAPRGLDPEVLDFLAVAIFSSKDDDFYDEESNANAAAECAVCLNEFEDGEKVRVLPRCGHRFHIRCIDLWFGSHNSCPFCRAAVEIESPRTSTRTAESESPPASGTVPQQCAARTSESSSGSADREISVETFGGEEESGLGLGLGEASGQKIRILAITRSLSRDPRLSRGEADLERGEGAERTPPPERVEI